MMRCADAIDAASTMARSPAAARRRPLIDPHGRFADRNCPAGCISDELTDARKIERMITLCASRGRRVTFLTNCDGFVAVQIGLDVGDVERRQPVAAGGHQVGDRRQRVLSAEIANDRDDEVLRLERPQELKIGLRRQVVPRSAGAIGGEQQIAKRRVDALRGGRPRLSNFSDRPAVTKL